MVAISNSKWVGKELYEKGGMKKERLLEFLEKHIFPKYKNTITEFKKKRYEIFHMEESEG